KPDDAIVPLDSTYVEQANGRNQPIVAAARTRHRGFLTSYVFAFAQGTEDRNEARQAALSPAALGYDGPVYAYNYFADRGVYVAPPQSISSAVADDGAYWIVVPVAASGVGFLGEAGKFVSNGRNRVSRIRDTGALTARIVFSTGESRLRFHGFALRRPEISATKAIVENLTYDPATRRFRFDLVARPGTAPVVTLKASSRSE